MRIDFEGENHTHILIQLVFTVEAKRSASQVVRVGTKLTFSIILLIAFE